MSIQNEQYWKMRNQKELRYRRLVEKNLGAIERDIQRLIDEYKKAYEDIINKDLANLYSKFSKNGVITYTELLKANRLNEYTDKLKVAAEMLGVKEEDFLENHFKQLFPQVSKDTAKALNVSYTIVPKDSIDRAINYPWSGKNFSDVIWDNKAKLISNLKATVVGGIVKGKSFTDLSRDLQNVMEKEAYVCRRIVRTETMHMINEAQLDRYKKSGVKMVRITNRDDGVACKTCLDRYLAKEEFEIDKAPILPTHPNCRCSYVPVIKLGEDTLQDNTKKPVKPVKQVDTLDDKLAKVINKFKKEIKMSDEYEESLLAFLSRAEDRDKEIIIKYMDNVKWIRKAETSHYTRDYHNGNLVGVINLDKRYDYKSKICDFRIQETIFHEFGHYVHLNQFENGNFYGSLKKFQNISDLDYRKVVGADYKLFQKWEKTADSTEVDDLLNFLKGKGKYNIDQAGLSDMFSAMTTNKFKGYWGHSTAYFNRNKMSRFNEIFANAFQIRVMNGVNSDEYKIVKKFFPNCLKMVEEILDNV